LSDRAVVTPTVTNRSRSRDVPAVTICALPRNAGEWRSTQLRIAWPEKFWVLIVKRRRDMKKLFSANKYGSLALALAAFAVAGTAPVLL
jgi:hypothetical protein